MADNHLLVWEINNLEALGVLRCELQLFRTEGNIWPVDQNWLNPAQAQETFGVIKNIFLSGLDKMAEVTLNQKEYTNRV